MRMLAAWLVARDPFTPHILHILTHVEHAQQVLTSPFIVVMMQRPPGLNQSPVSSTPLMTQPPPPPHRHLQGVQQPYSPHASSEPPTRPPPELEGRFVHSQQLGLQRTPSNSMSQQVSAANHRLNISWQSINIVACVATMTAT